jgi:hypothetical protein
VDLLAWQPAKLTRTAAFGQDRLSMSALILKICSGIVLQKSGFKLCLYQQGIHVQLSPP